MYYYIVEPQKISQREFERVQNVLYSSLSDFRISGEVVRVTGLRTIPQLVENAFAHEAKTVIAVGNDDTLHEVINAVGKREIVIGFIPIGKSEIGEIFGIRDIEHAAKTIAFRRVLEVDLGLINGYYFLSKINFGFNPDAGIRALMNTPSLNVQFAADEKFKANQEIIGGLIINSRRDSSEVGNPMDGVLDVILMPQLTKLNALLSGRKITAGFYEQTPKASILHVQKIEILEPQGLAIRIGNRVIGKAPAKITIMPKMLKLIVSKGLW